MKLLILGAVALAIATPAIAQTAPPHPVTAEHLVGKCESDGNTHLFTLMGYPASMGINCAAIDIDWSRQIAFLKNEDGDPLMIFQGRRGAGDYELIVEGMDNGLGSFERAKGRCLMFFQGESGDEPASPRSIECFVSVDRGGEAMAISIRFTVGEPLPATGTVVQAAGSCAPEEAIDVVLLMELERDAQKELPPIHSPPFACDRATAVIGTSVTFSQGDRPETRLRFSGQPGGEQTRLVIDSIAFGDRPPQRALTGTCLSMRMPDGQLQTSCGAAYREGADTRFVSTRFTPHPIK